MKKVEFAKEIFLNTLDTMKKNLNLLEFGMDMRTKKFQYARNQIFENTYRNLKKLFNQLEDSGIIKKCECNHSFRKGYSKCPKCGGSGFCNK